MKVAIIEGLKYDPFWKPLESIRATQFLQKAMGKTAYQTIWEPQLHNKFGDYMNEVSLAWFWARIKKTFSHRWYVLIKYL